MKKKKICFLQTEMFPDYVNLDESCKDTNLN